jgi:hypothetical protein
MSLHQTFLPGLPLPIAQTYAPWPVWSDSTPKPVEFTPLARKAAMKLLRQAQAFDCQTKQPHRHGGAIGHTALKVLQSMIFDFLNFGSGRLDPAKATIARKTNLCETAVATALDRLRDLGILTWVRRCSESWHNGRYVRAQQTNAYTLLPSSSWRGFSPPPDEPPPHPTAWGQAPRMPSILAAAALERHAGGSLKDAIRVLDLSPVNGLEAALARLGRAVLAAEK